MGNYMSDLGSYAAVGSARAPGNVQTGYPEDKTQLGMQDFLMLMVTEMQHQSLDSTADTSEMLNQLVMMQMVSAMTNMTDASIMGYAASLVGKTVTVAEYDGQGSMKEIVGSVTGTGTMNGRQVIFVNDKYYELSDILAVGTLPAKPEKPEKPDGAEKPDDAAPPDAPEEKPGEKPEAPAVPEVMPPEVPQVDPPKVPEVDRPERYLHFG